MNCTFNLEKFTFKYSIKKKVKKFFHHLKQNNNNNFLVGIFLFFLREIWFLSGKIAILFCSASMGCFNLSILASNFVYIKYMRELSIL